MTSAVVVARARALPSVARCSTSDALRARSRATAVCSVIVAINDWRWASPSGGSIAGDLHRLGAEHFGGVLAHRVRNRSRRIGRGERGGELLERGDLVGVTHLGAMQPVDAAGVPPRDGEGDRADHAQQQQLAEERIPRRPRRGSTRRERARRPTRRSPRRHAWRPDPAGHRVPARPVPRLRAGTVPPSPAAAAGRRAGRRRRPGFRSRSTICRRSPASVGMISAAPSRWTTPARSPISVPLSSSTGTARTTVGSPVTRPITRLADVRLVPVQDGLDVAAVAEIEPWRGVGVRRRAEPSVRRR